MKKKVHSTKEVQVIDVALCFSIQLLFLIPTKLQSTKNCLSLKSLFTRGEISREVRGYHGGGGGWGYPGTLGDNTGGRDITGGGGWDIGGYNGVLGDISKVGDLSRGSGISRDNFDCKRTTSIESKHGGNPFKLTENSSSNEKYSNK